MDRCEEKCEALKGRTVVLFPDLKAFDLWNKKAKEFSNIAQFTVSDLLETKANEADRQQGYDLADYLIKFDYKLFTKEKQPEALPEVKKPTVEQPQQNEVCEKCEKSESPNKTLFFENTPLQNLTKLNLFSNEIQMKNNENTTKKQPQPLWNIQELENYFSKIKLPIEPIKFNDYSIIENVSVFIENHLATVNFNNGKKSFLPYFERLQNLKILLETLNYN